MGANLPDIDRIAAALKACHGLSTEHLQGRNFRLERVQDVLEYARLRVRYDKLRDGIKAMADAGQPVTPDQLTAFLDEVGDHDAL